MSYARVIPRDLFNEADLLKCLGQLHLLTELMPLVKILYDGKPFRIEQTEIDGSIQCDNVIIVVRSHRVKHYRPLNSREPWPLYIEGHVDEPIAVFEDDGTLTDAATGFFTAKAM